MENPTPGVTDPPDQKPADLPPEAYEREMVHTREAITEKVAALESQVLDSVHAVTGTVEAVKEAITAAPTAVSDTVRQAVEAVRDGVKGTVKAVKQRFAQFSVSGCVRNYPWAAVGTTSAAGFVAGYFLSGGSRRRSGIAPSNAPPHPATAVLPTPVPRGPGLLGELFEIVGRQMREIAEKVVNSAMEAVKRNVGTIVPNLVDQAVERVAGNESDGNATGPAATQRV